jgi:acetyl-CoA synthetase
MTENKIVFYPEKDVVRNSNINSLKEYIGLNSIEELYDFSDMEIERFYEYVVRHTGIWFSKPYDKIRDGEKGKEFTRWFKNGEINVSYNCVERYKNSTKPAIKCVYEDGTLKVITYKELDDLTGKLAGALVDLGINKGDRIGIYMPMEPEALISMYAIMRAGAICVPMFSGYGKEAVETRVKDGGIKFIITTEKYQRKGKDIKMAEEIAQIKNTTLIILNKENINGIDFNDLMNGGKYMKSMNTGSEDPAIMLYTSGTTGKPKGTIHVHGGSFINIVKEVKYYLNFKEDDTIFWITDLGWMMGPWEIIGANALGGTVFIYPGAVDFPKVDRVWDLIENHGITILGLSPTFARTMKYKNITREFKNLRAFASSGEPWDEDSWNYVFNILGNKKVPICNVSGGTDIIGCFLASTPVTPLKPKCLFKGLGTGVSVFNSEGKEVFNEIGYLVSKEHLPSMTRGVWKNEERYLNSYWSQFPGSWSQGDWAMMDRDGYFFLFGRSDDIIKTSGKRIGPSEIEDVCDGIDGVVEAAAIGIPHEKKGEAIVIFYKGIDTEEIKEKIRFAVVKSQGKSFSPDKIFCIEELPKTRNGKIMRRVLKSAYLGQNMGDLTGLEDPNVIVKISSIGKDQTL